jgi:hypothetical protein
LFLKNTQGLNTFFNFVCHYFLKTVNTSFALPNISTNHLFTLHKVFLKKLFEFVDFVGGHFFIVVETNRSLKMETKIRSLTSKTIDKQIAQTASRLHKSSIIIVIFKLFFLAWWLNKINVEQISLLNVLSFLTFFPSLYFLLFKYYSNY